MQRSITDIRQELQGPRERENYTPDMLNKFRRKSAWDRGVCDYAEQLFDDYLERRDLLNCDGSIRIGKITEADLLNGAESWEDYSYGGCSLIYDSDVCEALCSPSERKRTRDGELPPNSRENWLDVQARALRQAASKVIKAVNRR